MPSPRILLFWLMLIAAAAGCTTGDVIRAARIATSANPAAAAQRAAQEKAISYAAHPKALQRDLKRFARLIEAFRKAVAGVWGRGEVKEPKPKEYVKYTQNYLSRAAVDFDRGVITVETMDQEAPLKSLKNAVVTTLLTPNDPRAVDLFSAKTVKLGQTPFLYGEVKDHEGQDIRWSWRAGRFADHPLAAGLKTRTVKNDGPPKTVRYVTIDMVRDHTHVRARKYTPLVERYAERFSISRNLIYAIMKTESDFNPYAVSTAPAFGLMQIVPLTAGRDVYRFLNKKDGAPSRRFLFIPENNIQYGTCYLHLLHFRYLDDITTPVSREYCAIAAYNGGVGGVLRAFDSDRDRARRRINGLPPLEVFKTLRARLPFEETRNYLAKVMEAKKEFVNF